MANVAFFDRTRAYQQEMFDRSMEGNRILVMDTGSGKTQVAMLRIHAELDRCGPEKRIWFLTPSVELCIQQHIVLQQAIPTYKMRLLTGQDNVDKWSDLKIWSAALDQARVVVSTHAILLDALRHGFIRLTSLALLVLDEAHHCVKNHPSNIIMRDFYHELKAAGARVPHILGLSASLIMSSKLSSVSTIEANLDSISMTPRVHREDLMLYVHRPECHIIRYSMMNTSDEAVSQGVRALKSAVARHKSMYSIPSALHGSKRDEIEREQRTLKRFLSKAEHILAELGASAADFFVRETVVLLRTKATSCRDMELDIGDSTVENLLTLLVDIRVEQACQQEGTHFPDISSKVRCLLDYLLNNEDNDLRGIVFVTQRIVASVLSSVLNDHTHTNEKLQCVPSVGGSSYSGRKFTITELLDRRVQQQALSSFRKGQTNVIIATSVLEEGIDVQACNVVACFDLPANLKSYIQRRGRARQQRSRYGLLLESNADPSKVATWRRLENELIALCQEERQEAEISRSVEAEDEIMDYTIGVESTGARFDADAALQHLYHFCHLLQKDPGIDPTPQFHFDQGENGSISASVALPQSVPAHTRLASSRRAWRTERAARKDAAFHAYAALFRAGLLNDHLLPISQEWNVNEGLEEAAPPPQVQILSPDVWTQSKEANAWYKVEFDIIPSDSSCSDQEPSIHLILNTYQQLSTPPPLKLHWDGQTSFEVRFGLSTSCPKPHVLAWREMHSFTSALYRAPRSNHHWQVDEELLTLFQPSRHEDFIQDMTELPACQLVGKQLRSLVRVRSRDGKPYVFRRWTRGGEVVCTRLTNRRNFLISARPQLASEQFDSKSSVNTHQDRTEIFSVHDCTIGVVAMPWARVGLFMPDVLQHIHDFAVVNELMAKFLHGLLLPDREGIRVSIRMAITTPSAQRLCNYEQLEFLGDSVLKYITSCYLFAAEPNWPQGYLSQRRSLLVCNATLACAAIRTNLCRYIISEPVNYRHWTLPSSAIPQHLREVSSKSLADVVEALIGAVWLEVDMDTARRCVNLFLPSMPLSLQPSVPANSKTQLSSAREQIEALIGYTFVNHAFLSEALTHPSFAQVLKTDSYERLEFLGDAVLDMIIAELLAEHVQKLTQGRMTQIKAALVNADLLGFFCFHLRCKEIHRAVGTTRLGGQPTEVLENHERSLAAYVRFHPDMSAIYLENDARYKEFEQDVQQQLHHGPSHPWGTLKQLGLNKMFSDVVESVVAAIFLDSGQQLGACRPFLDSLGLVGYAKRVIDEELSVENCDTQTYPVPLMAHTSPNSGGDGDMA